MNKIIVEKQTKIIVEKSKFLSFIFNCENLTKQNEIIKNIKNENLSSTHVCFASLIDIDNQIYSNFNDDKEPSLTAGFQILQALKENNMINTLLVVVRYFGGIKLGASNLAKTYKNCALSCIEDNKREVEKKELFFVTCKYNDFDYLKNYFIQNKLDMLNLEFKDNISFKAYLNKLQKTFVEKFSITETLKEYKYC